MVSIFHNGRVFLTRRGLLSGGILAVLMFFGIGFAPGLYAQQSATPAGSTNSADAATPEARLAALKLEMTNAYSRVLLIVNQPVKAYVRSGSTEASIFKPGWFHAGAAKPDFNTVDIRQSQEFPYNESKFVTSDLNPGLVFSGQDLEFNSMTKYFYTNRTLPKHKLTETQMLEINRLYRIIGKCEGEIDRLQSSPADTSTAPSDSTTTTSPGSSTAQAQPAKEETETETVVPGQSFEMIRAIPMQTRKLYAGITVGVLLLLVIALRVLRKPSS